MGMEQLVSHPYSFKEKDFIMKHRKEMGTSLGDIHKINVSINSYPICLSFWLYLSCLFLLLYLPYLQ